MYTNYPVIILEVTRFHNEKYWLWGIAATIIKLIILYIEICIVYYVIQCNYLSIFFKQDQYIEIAYC